MTKKRRRAAAAAFNQGSIQLFKESIHGRVILPGNREYDAARKAWNGAVAGDPALIVRCIDSEDVAQSVCLAVEYQLPVAVRGSEDAPAGSIACQGGVLVDVSGMKGILVDPIRRLALAQAGITWGELGRTIRGYGLSIPGGIISTPEISGLSLGEGIAWLKRKFGLACISLVSAELVNRDGQIMKTSSTENPGLLRGIRGGAGSMGIVTTFIYRLSKEAQPGFHYKASFSNLDFPSLQELI